MFKKIIAAGLFSGLSSVASAGFIGDTIDITVDSAFGNAISGSTTVGAGAELSGSSLIWDYSIDVSDESFAITVSKPWSAGNFTGIFNSIIFENIDSSISGVTFNPGAGSLLTGSTHTLDLSTPGSFELSWFTFAAGNTPASALSHTFVWDVEFGSPVNVSAPSTVFISLFGLLGLVGLRTRQRKI